jgi:sulfate adenylyltransferase subunit 1
VQYTRNMVTGASTADLALVLVDARKGVIEQTRRHAALSALLRVPHLVLAVNKMDLVAYDQGVYADIVRDFTALTDDLRSRFGALPTSPAIPMAALQGDNVVTAARRCLVRRAVAARAPRGRARRARPRRDAPARFPVQYVIRPMSTERPDYRGYAGHRRERHACASATRSSCCRPGGRRRSRASTPSTARSSRAVARQAVTVRLAEELDVSRGDMRSPRPRRRRSCRSSRRPCAGWPTRRCGPGARVLVKHTTRTVRRSSAR